MGIYIGRCREIAVAEPLLDLFHRDAVREQQRRAAMPEIVEAYMPQAVLIQQLRKCGGKIVRGNQRSHLVHTDVVQIPLVVAPAAYAPVLVLLFFVR